jgi:hypothetical protein
VTDRRKQRNERSSTASGTSQRVPPHNLAAEESLLGAALLSTTALEALATKLTPGDFYKPTHGHIAAVLIDAFENGWKADPTTVADKLKRQGLLDDVGGQGALVGLQATTPATASAPRYAQIVHDHATLRRLIGSAAEISELAYSLPDDAHDALVRAQVMLGDVAASNGARTYSTLEVADVAALLETDLVPEEADFLTRSDGLSLIYAGKMHFFQGEPSSGKSWLALLAALEILGKGGSVVYLDYEDSSRGILGRLLALGADPSAVRERFAYVQPIGPFGVSERAELARLLERLNPDLVVIDGVAEALARDGLSEDSAPDFIAWIEKLPRWITRTGAAVVMLDHVVKDREHQGRWARGTGAKLGVVDGATYQIKTSTPFSRKRSGQLRVVIAKDKPGGVGAIGETAAVVHVEPHADGERVVIRLEAYVADEHRGDSWRPTRIMARVMEMVEESEIPLTATTVKTLLGTHKPGLVTQAIHRLLAEGYLEQTSEGKRRNVLRVLRRYEIENEPPAAPTPQNDPGLFDGEPDPEDPDSGPLDEF